MNRKMHRSLLVVSLLIVAAMVLGACAPAATTTPAPQAAPPTTAPARAAATAAPVRRRQPAKAAVGIVLPTKRSSRAGSRTRRASRMRGWEHLFSQGDSAKEKANVEVADHQGHQSPDHLPAGRHCCRGRR